jgi:hypothetical protein
MEYAWSKTINALFKEMLGLGILILLLYVTSQMSFPPVNNNFVYGLDEVIQALIPTYQSSATLSLEVSAGSIWQVYNSADITRSLSPPIFVTKKTMSKAVYIIVTDETTSLTRFSH